MKRALILGLGVSGQAVARRLLTEGWALVAMDRVASDLVQRSDVKGLIALGLVVIQEDKVVLDLFDLVVVSPGIPYDHPIYQEARERRIPCTGEIAIACERIKNRMIGITGTNGKTTVTLAVTHILNVNGLKAKSLGNIGLPLLQHPVQDEGSILVVELSSYQLETLKFPCLDAGALLNITPDHLDRYGSMASYASAKWRILQSLKEGAHLWVSEQVKQEYPMKSSQIKTYGHSQINDIFVVDGHCKGINGEEFEISLDLRGHDLDNFLASYALCHAFGIRGHECVDAYKSFKKPAHRIQYVRSISGVHFYDDSKGTNIDAVMRAVESLKGPVILIAGGVDKGASYSPWIHAFGEKVKDICVIGEASSKIAEDLAKKWSVKICSQMEDAVRSAFHMASEGDSVLLSPGCSSYDMFDNYVHRGEEYQRIVNSL